MRPIKFRGREFFSKKFIFGQTIRQTDDGFDMWTGDDWAHCTDLVQLVGYDANGNEVYEGDELISVDGDYEDTAKLFSNVCDSDKLKDAQS